MQVPTETRRSIGFPGAVLTSGCELPDGGRGGGQDSNSGP